MLRRVPTLIINHKSYNHSKANYCIKWRPIQRNNVPHQGGINHQGMIQVGGLITVVLSRCAHLVHNFCNVDVW